MDLDRPSRGVTADSSVEVLGIVVPDEEYLAEWTYDFMDTLWRGEPKITVKLNNWGLESMTLVKGQEIGFVETVDLKIQSGMIPRTWPQ